ncbi:MAG: hypothetical protein ACK40O_08645 [Allosphingosinicella sp.]
MDMTASAQRKPTGEELRQPVAGLLARTPTITIAADAEIVRFFRMGPPLRAGLLPSDRSIRPKREALERDHPGEFALGVKDVAVVALIVGTVVLVTILLRDGGLEG